MPSDKTPAKEILARNLRKLMDRPGAKKISTYKLAGVKKGEKQKGPLSPRTVGRIRNAEVEATLDHIQAIAKFFVLDPWQLLVPNFSVDEPPHLAFTKEEIAAYARMEESILALQRLRASATTDADTPIKP